MLLRNEKETGQRIRELDIRPAMIKVDPAGDFQPAVWEGAEVLRKGRIVAYPTESFYGLAVDVTNEEAIHRLFLAKRMRSSHPVLILIPSLDVLEDYVDSVPRAAHRLMEAFWPGGLTLVFGASENLSTLITGGTGKVGIRLSSHPVATALAKALDAPITGTSANVSGEPSCRSAGEVVRSLGKKLGLILDGGKTEGKVGSTVLDVTLDRPQILREGMISREQLEKTMRE